MSKKLSNLLRHGSLLRGHWSDVKWKKSMAKGGGNKKRYQYCTDSSGTMLYLRALQGHSGRNLVLSFITRQCRDSGRFLPVHLSCRTYNQFTFHHQIGIDTGRSKFEQETDTILSACESHWTRNTRILTRSTWKHRVLHGTCIKHGRNIKTRCIGSTSTLL